MCQGPLGQDFGLGLEGLGDVGKYWHETSRNVISCVSWMSSVKQLQRKAGKARKAPGTLRAKPKPEPLCLPATKRSLNQLLRI